MKKSTKSFVAVAMVALTCGFFALESSNEIVRGNIDALTSGENNNTIEWYNAYKGINNTNYPTKRMRGSNENPSFCNYAPCLSTPDGTCGEVVCRP